MLKQLSEYFNTDKSTLTKKTLINLYENMKDIETGETGFSNQVRNDKR